MGQPSCGRACDGPACDGPACDGPACDGPAAFGCPGTSWLEGEEPHEATSMAADAKGLQGPASCATSCATSCARPPRLFRQSAGAHESVATEERGSVPPEPPPEPEPEPAAPKQKPEIWLPLVNQPRPSRRSCQRRSSALQQRSVVTR